MLCSYTCLHITFVHLNYRWDSLNNIDNGRKKNEPTTMDLMKKK